MAKGENDAFERVEDDLIYDVEITEAHPSHTKTIRRRRDSRRRVEELLESKRQRLEYCDFWEY